MLLIFKNNKDLANIISTVIFLFKYLYFKGRLKKDAGTQDLRACALSEG